MSIGSDVLRLCFNLVARLTGALRKLNIEVEGGIATPLGVQPVSSRVHHIDEEMTSSKAPSAAHPIQLISAITKQQLSPPVPVGGTEHFIPAAPAGEVAAEPSE